MSAPEAAAAQADPQVVFAKLRAWIAEHCSDANQVRRAAYQMSLSHIVHCALKFGPDERLNSLSSRDLMNLLIFVNGEVAEYLMRVAFFRAIIEGEHEIYEHLALTPFIPECRAWYWQIVEAMVGRTPDAEAVTVWLDNMSGEEKSVARLLIARVFPDVAHVDWLNDVPDVTIPQYGRLAAELCLLLLMKPSYESIVKNYLRSHPHARYALPEHRWPKL